MGKKLKTDIKNKRERIKFFEGMPSEISGPMIELSAGREAAVDGCRGVIDYYENVIKLRVDGGTVTFSGNGLTLAELNDSAALIRGRIENVELSLR